jgi:hypothetical protein
MQRVSSVALLEPPCPTGAAGAAFLEVMSPVIEVPHRRHRRAVADFYGLIGDPHRRDTIERTVPGGVVQADKNAATSFEIEGPAVAGWSFGPEQAGAATCPVLSMCQETARPCHASAAIAQARRGDSFRRSRNGTKP